MIEPWLTQQEAGMIGGILGAVLGSGFGGIGGGLGGPLAQRGKAKGFVLGMFYTGIGIGVALLIFGIVAIVMGQPMYVVYPFMLIGFILTVVMGCLLPVVKRAYAAAASRKLAASEFRAGA
ncbi:MAG: hypothetical protein KF757_01570 [Phycisphaeraceae bacterium]|nr:hypothetical protein [Phycisphaeraceae bacterium]MCW5761899.1 hypothetical protein [Phycisphaeraceae bacterium]